MTVETIKREQCTGCKNCLNVCLQGAVSMETDKEGFWYPKVNSEKCTNCGLCLQKCPAHTISPVNELFEPEVYACYTKEEATRIKSTSGGIFTELAKTVLSNGGVVIGARYTDDFMVEHASVFSIQDIPLLRQSKYLQSDTHMVFRQTSDYVKQGKLVLFCGTPCQNAALRSYLGKSYDNLLQCDFICRGVISPKVFRKYLDMLRTEYHSEIKSVQFKNKDNGWHRFGTRIIFENGKSYYKDRYHDSYMVGYLEHNLYMRPSCHRCHFKGVRQGDITLGDFWGIERIYPEVDQDKGTSVVILNSPKGKMFFEQVKEHLIWKNCSLENVRMGNDCLENVAPAGRNRSSFFAEIDNCTFAELISKYAVLSKPQILKKNIYKIASRIKHTLWSDRGREDEKH
jgi:Coenzyme F420-reducing hydrogenase, beta subunit